MTKTCCVCGTDVTHAKRYKDSSGLYWCETCNQKDRATPAASMTCPGCTKSFPPIKMVRIAGRFLCPDCARAKAQETQRAAAPSAPKFSMNFSLSGDKKKLLIMLAVMALLALVAIYVNFMQGSE